MAHSILVPIDGSDRSFEALEFTLEHYPDADVTALHVIELGTPRYGQGSLQGWSDEVRREEEAHADEVLAEVERIADEHDDGITTETGIGRPSRSILDYTDLIDADQIVMGSEGRTGVSRLLLGSVAETVTRRAEVPVTIVR